MLDKYACFAELAQFEQAGTDYRVSVVEQPHSPVLILAPHGGRIEEGTSEVAALVAGAEHSLFSFEGLKVRGNRDLHITSHRFDHPDCLTLLSRSQIALAIHGCRGASRAYVGGLDLPFAALLMKELQAADFPVSSHGHRYPGKNPSNICNRTRRGCGAQLELTMDLRTPPKMMLTAQAVRRALDEYVGLATDGDE